MKTLKEIKNVFKNVSYFVVDFKDNVDMFGYYTNEVIFFNDFEYESKEYKIKMYNEMFQLMRLGFITVVRKPKKNELGYFFNKITKKEEITMSNKPFISNFDKMIGNKFTTKTSDFTFKFFEPLNDPYVKIFDKEIKMYNGVLR